MTVTERVTAHRERQISDGKKQINVTLSGTAIRKLDKLAKVQELTRAQVIESLINQ